MIEKIPLSGCDYGMTDGQNKGYSGSTVSIYACTLSHAAEILQLLITSVENTTKRKIQVVTFFLLFSHRVGTYSFLGT